MTQKAALAESLLKGEVVSIMTCFKRFGITNCPREIGRSIERPFGVTCDRKEIKTETRWGEYCWYYEYRLFFTDDNAAGIEKMKAYVEKIAGHPIRFLVKKGPKIITPKKEISTQSLF